MKSEKSSTYLLPIFLYFLICIYSITAKSQTDSILKIREEILNANTLDNAIKASERIGVFVKKQNGQEFLTNAELILSAAAKCKYPKDIYYRLFAFYEGLSKAKNLEPEFTLFAIKLEHNPDFVNEDVQHQLFYYYTLLYYRLKEYYYAEKYGKLYAANNRKSFPEDLQSNLDLNAMTILAFIVRSKNDFNGALIKLNETLDSSISQKIWPGLV